MKDELVHRTFTAGTLVGLSVYVTIPNVEPRPVGTLQRVDKPMAGSPYVDEVVGWAEAGA